MNADELVGYGMVAVGVGAPIVVVVVVWVVRCLMHPWVEPTVAAHIEAADATEYPELDERWER